ncbi:MULTISPECIES: helix-turn-helix domain-containing protein [unclassified Simplicispira]|uniref:helix-turn-helix domain-containing protein n=1 Tax=unclassified Simplicispira TaxID=2630407 RepID=UPI000D5F79A6|nr:MULTISPECIES: helix-turn-helix domain-containing protein [unclassified Simplicispira]PVY57469.1 putative DNA-binding mobile mystery protein A [Simplicispira sp. 125]REG18413.1 putative DNA-binding mobile mystery protein A [Simplicispira sp. 110]
MKSRLDFTRLAELDRQFCEFAKLHRDVTPRCGWVKTIRLALGMSSTALGTRTGMTAQGVRKLEQAEANQSISLKTLAKLADGLDCEVRYILLPRSSLLDQVLKQSREIHGTQLPTSINGTTEMLLDTKDLGALSALFANVNKRGFWL